MKRSGIHRLDAADAEAFVAVRRAALLDAPFAFAASPEDDPAVSVEFVRSAMGRPDQAVFGYFDDGALLGIVGIARVSGSKQHHKARVWGLYVAPAARRRGLGRLLLDAVLQHARSWSTVDQVHLSVTATAKAAFHLYSSAGFHVWGVEPRAFQLDGISVDESHLVLSLT